MEILPTNFCGIHNKMKGWPFMSKSTSNGVKNTKQLLVGLAVVVGALALFAWLGMPAGSSEKESAQVTRGLETVELSADEAVYDFGTISMAAGNVSRTFRIRNLSALPIAIEKIYTSCMCTTAVLDVGGEKFGPYGMPGHGFIPKINKTLDPGAEATVEVVFDPAAHGPSGVGLIERVVVIENNGGKPLELGFTAVVTP